LKYISAKTAGAVRMNWATMNEQEAEWRTEFERFGEEQTRWAVHSGQFTESKRQFAFRWLGDEARARRIREQRTYQYVRWTFVAAVAAVIVGLIGIAMTYFAERIE
jgi:anti-sigma-K factor RskA